MSVFGLLKQEDLLHPSDVAYGFERGWAETEEVADFLYSFAPSDLAARLATSKIPPELLIQNLLDEWSRRVSNQAIHPNHAARIWMYGHLKDLQASEASSDHQLLRLQEIYGLLGYPEEMRACSMYYVPEDEKSNSLKVGDQTASPLMAMSFLINSLAEEFKSIR
jgi:hypothetical protein